MSVRRDQKISSGIRKRLPIMMFEFSRSCGGSYVQGADLSGIPGSLRREVVFGAFYVLLWLEYYLPVYDMAIIQCGNFTWYMVERCPLSVLFCIKDPVSLCIYFMGNHHHELQWSRNVCPGALLADYDLMMYCFPHLNSKEEKSILQ